MGTLSLLKNGWASKDPIRVHGFIRRLATERRLRQSERGTFLLRFSESRHEALVVSFTEHVSVIFASRPSGCTAHGIGRFPGGLVGRVTRYFVVQTMVMLSA